MMCEGEEQQRGTSALYFFFIPLSWFVGGRLKKMFSLLFCRKSFHCARNLNDVITRERKSVSKQERKECCDINQHLLSLCQTLGHLYSKNCTLSFGGGRVHYSVNFMKRTTKENKSFLRKKEERNAPKVMVCCRRIPVIYIAKKGKERCHGIKWLTDRNLL